jgi:hypothetical protein
MDVTTVQFSNRQELANAFERWASDARVELCVADPARLVLRYALGLAPVSPAHGTSDKRLHLARSHPSEGPRSPGARPRSSTWR